MKNNVLSLLLLASAVAAARGDTVYVTSLTSNCVSSATCGQGQNFDVNPETGLGVYNENGLGSFTSAIANNPEKPPTPGARFFSNSFSNSTPDVGITINPVLGVPGGVYRLYHVYSSSANNVSTSIILGATNTANCTLSFTNTDKFQRAYGAAVGGVNPYQFIGWVTNDVATNSPIITFYFEGGAVSAGASQRLVVDTFRFDLESPCLDVPKVNVTGPLAANLNTVVVSGVSASATAVTVYQDSGADYVPIGTLTSGVVAGNNAVPVTGLIKGATVAATQTIGGQEACAPTANVLIGNSVRVGGGANPRVRVVLSVRETSSTGPVGATGSTTGVGANIHFLGASTRIGGAPGDGPVLTPANTWQTLTFDRGTVLASNAVNAAGTLADGPGYAANDTVAIRVYSFRTVPENGVLIYSRVPAESAVVTSNDVFTVNWTWDAVPGADGYRLLRNYNSDNYTNSSVDVTVNSYNDVNSWGFIAPVTPSQTQTNASIKWNAASGSSPAGTQNDLQGQWGTIDAIAFAIDDISDTGPYDIYIDNLQNGSTVFQTFDNAVGNTAAYGFQPPGYSGSTSGNILGAPNSARVSIRAADTGDKSLHVQFQWNGTNTTKWLRFTTSGAVGQSPQINLDDPTSIRFLMLPVGGTLPAQPAAPTLSVSNNASGQQVLTWSGTHNLQSSATVNGTYNNVAGVTNSPWVNTITDPEQFFRLADPYDN